MSLFPVPVSGQQIPRGWFARLVRYMNSLFLRGDGSYLAVSHTPEGTFIRPTPYLIDQLNKAAAAPASGGDVTVNGMVYPDWAFQVGSEIAIAAEIPVSLTQDAWIYICGHWRSTSNVSGTSQLYLQFALSGGGTRSYLIGGFHSTDIDQKQYFQCFLPVCKNSTFTLHEFTSSSHAINYIDAYYIPYSQTP